MSVLKVLLSGMVVALVNTSSGVFASEFADGVVGDGIVPVTQEAVLNDDSSSECSSARHSPIQEVVVDSFEEDAARDLEGASEGSVFVRLTFADGDYSDVILAEGEELNQEEVANGREVMATKMISKGNIRVVMISSDASFVGGAVQMSSVDLMASVAGLSIGGAQGDITILDDLNEVHEGSSDGEVVDSEV